MFDSGGFRRSQENAVAVVNPDGTTIGAVGGGGGGLAQLQIREGAAWVNAPGSSAKGLLIEPAEGVAADGGVLPTKLYVVAGYDGANVRSIKTSNAGVVAISATALPLPAGAATEATLAGVKTGTDKIPASPAATADVQAVRDRLPAALDADGGLKVHAQSAVPVTDNGGSLTVDSAQLPSALVSGRLDVNIGAAPQVAVNNVETIADNAGFTDGTSKLFPAGYVFDEVAGTALTENDVAAARINAQRAAVTVLEDGATRGRYATVKAASTAPVAADPAQVVSLSPNGPITPPTLTKGTQGATGMSVQRLNDAGRNPTNYFHAAPIITTTAEVMQTLTGYKSGAAVAATATPAVVTAGKTYRVERITVAYIAATVIGGALLRLRANLSGVGVVGSPLVWATYVGIPAVFTAGAAATYVFDFPEGLEFAAGTGIALGVLGGGAVPTTGTITGYVMASIEGYEY